MPKITGATDAQSTFLRKLKRDPVGLPADEWPSAVIMRRWMRRPGFRQALQQLWRVLQLQADLHLAAAAGTGAQALHARIRNVNEDEEQVSNHALVQLVRLSHLRCKTGNLFQTPENTERAPSNPLHPDLPPELREELTRKLLAEDGDGQYTPEEHREEILKWTKW